MQANDNKHSDWEHRRLRSIVTVLLTNCLADVRVSACQYRAERNKVELNEMELLPSEVSNVETSSELNKLNSYNVQAVP